MSVLGARLEKYRSVVSSLKSDPHKLRQKLDQLKPEIVRMIKKKRAVNANKAAGKKYDEASVGSRELTTSRDLGQVQPM